MKEYKTYSTVFESFFSANSFQTVERWFVVLIDAEYKSNLTHFLGLAPILAGAD